MSDRFRALALASLFVLSVLAGAATLTVIAGPGAAANTPTQTPTETPTQTSTWTSTATDTATPTPTTANPTPTATPTSTSAPQEPEPRRTNAEYSITELRQGGLVPANADNIQSIRALGNPPRGFSAMRFRDPTVIDDVMGNPGSWKQITSDAVVHENEVQLYGSAFGSVAGDYELVVVYWQEDRRETANGTSEVIAANQTVERHTISFDEDDVYSYANISLAHQEAPWQITTWLERGGEPVDGARWRFTHQSNPGLGSIYIDSPGDAWGWSLRWVVIPAIVSLVIGLAAARITIRITGRGPGYGVVSWLLLVGFVFVGISGLAYYQISVILDNVPWIMGVSVGVIAYGAGLTFHEPAKKIAFLRRNLVDAQTIDGGIPGPRGPGGPNAEGAQTDGGAGVFPDDMGAEMFDEFTEALFLDLPEVPAVRTPDGYRVPVQGVRPFFARLFADAALLDLSNIATRQKVKAGRIDELITLDPMSGGLIHKPARMVRTLPWDTLDPEASSAERLLAAAATGGILLGPATVGYIALDALASIPWVGVVIGAAVSLVMMYSAEDGWIDFEIAPANYQRAEDTLTILQRAYKVAEEDETGREMGRKERAKTRAEARDDIERERKTATEVIMEDLGVGEIVSGESDEDHDDYEQRERPVEPGEEYDRDPKEGGFRWGRLPENEQDDAEDDDRNRPR